MNLRKERIHQCGLSNIDFKTRKDNDAFQTFKSDFRATNFGTMGKTGLKKMAPPTDPKESLMITSGFKLSSELNPKFDESKKYMVIQGKELKQQ